MTHSVVDSRTWIAALQATGAGGDAGLPTPWGNVPWTALASLIVAVISGLVAYGLARAKLNEEIAKIRYQVDLQRETVVSGQRHQYITPLRFAASTLAHRLEEIYDKQKAGEYGQVAHWMKQVKDHTDGNLRRPDFPVWCYYEGIFALTTLYYTCVYFRCAREVISKSQFRELDPSYAELTETHISKIGKVFDWGSDSFWKPIQDIIGERFMNSNTGLGYEDLCITLDSQKPFQYGPFILPMDVYIHGFDPDQTVRMRQALLDLISFIDSRPNPEDLAGATSDARVHRSGRDGVELP